MTNFINHNDQVIQSIVDSIIGIAHPDKIILFGSRATGKAKKDSDYDICVLKKRIRNNRKFAYKIRSHIDVFVQIDILVTTPNHFSKQSNKCFYVYYDIEKFGKVIYEKN